MDLVFIRNRTHQQGIPREQIQMLCLEGLIGKDNPVRFIEAFVEKLDLSKLGFTVQVQKAEGRPSYESKLFLKIYLYGYLKNYKRTERLKQLFAILKLPPPPPKVLIPMRQRMLEKYGKDILLCPLCEKGQLELVATYRKGMLCKTHERNEQKINNKSP